MVLNFIDDTKLSRRRYRRVEKNSGKRQERGSLMTSQILRSMLFMTALTALLIALKKVLNKHITAAWQYRIDYLFFVILALPIVPCGKRATNITEDNHSGYIDGCITANSTAK